MKGPAIAGDLNNVSYVTLALIGDGGASPQDLVEMNRSGGAIFYAVAASRLYAEPKRLERLGYVTSEKRPGKTRERSFYTLTDSGRRALREWILEPPSLPRIQNEAVPKLMSGDILGDDEQLLEVLLTLRGEIEGQQAKLDVARERLEQLPHRRSYLLLVSDLGNRLLQVQRDWLDEVERELGRSK
ncbi:MAG TPA: PadR family transcriptional regulator [Gaiellaceae bacterium]|nr:PadR family transcriptional regulator [Gaiellaceae bacterium]